MKGLAAIAATILCVMGCDSPDVSLQKKLIGTWKGSDEVATYTITFYPNGDGTFATGGSIAGHAMHLINGELRGKWYVKDGRCYLNYQDASFPGGKLGIRLIQSMGKESTFALDIKSIDSDKMVTAIGVTYTRQR